MGEVETMEEERIRRNVAMISKPGKEAGDVQEGKQLVFRLCG